MKLPVVSVYQMVRVSGVHICRKPTLFTEEFRSCIMYTGEDALCLYILRVFVFGVDHDLVNTIHYLIISESLL